jgi:hypothetical protein
MKLSLLERDFFKKDREYAKRRKEGKSDETVR